MIGLLVLVVQSTCQAMLYLARGTSNFINNSAGHTGAGGAIYTSDNTVISFIGINNSAEGDGAIFSSGNTVISFNGISSFINNSAQLDGGAMFTL